MDKILSRVIESRPEGVLESSYMEMRMKVLEALKLVVALNDFERDQEELLDFAYCEILPMGNPYQELFFKKPEELLRLNIVNWSPVNGRVMALYGKFIARVVELMSEREDSIIPSVELLSEIISGAGLKYIEPEIMPSLGGTRVMGKTVRNTPKTKPTKAELQDMLGQQRQAKVGAIALAKQKAQAEKAELKEKFDAISDKIDPVMADAGIKISKTVEEADSRFISGKATIEGKSINEICAEAVTELKTGVKEEEPMKKADAKSSAAVQAELVDELHEGQKELSNELNKLKSDVRIFNEKLSAHVVKEPVAKKPSWKKRLIVGALLLGGAIVGGKIIKGVLSKNDEVYAD